MENNILQMLQYFSRSYKFKQIDGQELDAKTI